jgi:hypothetical protein
MVPGDGEQLKTVMGCSGVPVEDGVQVKTVMGEAELWLGDPGITAGRKAAASARS